MRTIYRLVSGSLAVAMLCYSMSPNYSFSMLNIASTQPITAYAANTIIASGNCGVNGNNVTWSLDEYGLLLISGNGAMADWGAGGFLDTPWNVAGYREEIKSVRITNGVTRIGNAAFEVCSNLKSVSLPNSVIEIGDKAFYMCKQLTEVSIPDSVSSIGYYAFGACAALEKVDLPADLKAIGEYTFVSCTKLQDIVIPGNVRSIGGHAFEGCSQLSSVIMSNSVTSIGERAFISCPSLSKVVLSNKLTTIGKHAFYGSALTSVNLPDSLSTIGACAFGHCNKLSKVSIPNSVSSLGEYAFTECALKEITIPNSIQLLERSVFAECKDLAIVHMENGLSEVSICCFSGCTSLESITIPDSVETIDEYAFSYCSSLSDISLPQSVSSIGKGAFSSCSNLSNITILNDTCSIAEQSVPYSTTIHGHANSAAQLYAANGNYTFVAIDESDFADEFIVNLHPLEYKVYETVAAITDVSVSNPSAALTVVSDTKDAISIHALTAGKCEIVVTLANGDRYAVHLTVVANDFETETTSIITTTSTTTTSNTTSTVDTSPNNMSSTETSSTTTSTATTSTTTTSTTTSSTTMTTSTITTVTTTLDTITTSSTTVSPFIRGVNDWGFLNSTKTLTVQDPSTKKYLYYITKEDKAKLFENLSNIERKKIEDVLLQRSGGSCYGMSVTSILQNKGLFPLDQIIPGKKALADIDQSSINDNIKSAINYYQMLQYTKAISQKVRETERMEEKDKLQYLIDSLKQGNPVLLGYTYDAPDGINKLGHAVVAYGIRTNKTEVISFSNSNRKNFDVEVNIYNCSTKEDSSAYNLYINTSNWQWCILMTNDESEYNELAIMNVFDIENGTVNYHRKGCISLVASDIDLLNYNGLFNETSYSFNDDTPFYANMSMIPLNGSFSLATVSDSSNGSFFSSEDDGGIRFTANFFDDEAPNLLEATMDGDLCYCLAPKTPQLLEMTMEYEHCLLSAHAESASKITVNPNSSIECLNTSGQYSISMVLDEGYHQTDWHELSVEGIDGGTLNITPDKEGWILSGDNLRHVTISTNNYSASAQVSFSTKYTRVLIYEISNTKIGINADLGEDGSFETVIAKTVYPLAGDMDANDELHINDAVLLARFISEDDSQPFYAIENTDVDNNGIVDILDLTALLRMLSTK